MSNNYNNKHTFLSGATSPHAVSLILNLIYKKVLEKSNILLIIHGDVLSDKSIEDTCRAHGIDVIRWEDAKSYKLSFFTLNPLSLLTTNSNIIAYCIDNNFVKPSDINILMQDDELDRWSQLHNETGSLQVNKSALIDKDVLSVLEVVDNYVVPYDYLGEKLEVILGRQLNIIDAVLPFNVLDYNSQNILESFLDARKQSKSKSNYKILVHTKPGEVKNDFYAVAMYILKNKNIKYDNKITLGLWFGSSLKGVIYRKALTMLIRKTGSPITIEIHKYLSHGQYLLMLHQYDCLILQSRGGFSTAKYFAEKVGKVITLTNSPNDLTFKRDYKIDTYNSKSLSSALQDAIGTSQVDRVKELTSYSKAIVERHNRSIKVLQEFWQEI